MITLIVRHPVQSYDGWKPVFDEHESVRRAHGEVEHRIYRFRDWPDSLVIHNDFPSEAQARAFKADPSLPEAMQRAGVTAEPILSFATLMERRTYDDTTTPGSVAAVHQQVRDVQAWKAVFDEYGPELHARGVIEHRIYLDHEVADRVVVHLDVPSYEAGMELSADPGLRAMLERAGVLGEPGIGVAYLAERKVYAEAPAPTA